MLIPLRPPPLRRRVVARDLDLLPERVALGQSFFASTSSMIATAGPPGSFASAAVEGAPAEEAQSDRGEIIRAHAVPARAEGEAVGGRRRMGIRRGVEPGALHVLA